jgi:DNA processing protein
MGYEPLDTDTIAALTTLSPGLLAGQLLSLELAGHVERLPGGLFQRVNR